MLGTHRGTGRSVRILVIAGSRPALNRVAWEAGFLTHTQLLHKQLFHTQLWHTTRSHSGSHTGSHTAISQFPHKQLFHTQLFHPHTSQRSHTLLTRTHTRTHNSSTYNFVLIDPPPPPLSFLPSPSRLNFCSDYWKKLICGVFRSSNLIVFFDISRKSIPESLCNWGFFSPGTINFTGSLRLRGAKNYFHVEGFLQKILISSSFD